MRQLQSGTPVRIRFPRALRGTVGTVLRPADGGYEVGFFSSRGRPEHAVLRPWKLVVIKPGESAEG
jgi:hypothetical protein